MANELNNYTLSGMNEINIMIKMIANEGEAVLNGLVYADVYRKNGGLRGCPVSLLDLVLNNQRMIFRKVHLDHRCCVRTSFFFNLFNVLLLLTSAVVVDSKLCPLDIELLKQITNRAADTL